MSFVGRGASDRPVINERPPTAERDRRPIEKSLSSNGWPEPTSHPLAPYGHELSDAASTQCGRSGNVRSPRPRGSRICFVGILADEGQDPKAPRKLDGRTRRDARRADRLQLRTQRRNSVRQRCDHGATRFDRPHLMRCRCYYVVSGNRRRGPASPVLYARSAGTLHKPLINWL